MTGDNAARILRLRSVLERTGLTRSTLYRKLHEGTFPKPVRLSPRCVGWQESEIDAWVRSPIS
ncbi:MAG: helix-turn-helix transcriptional regulator [Bacillota bacterium]